MTQSDLDYERQIQRLHAEFETGLRIIAKKDERIAKLEADVNSLNNLLRQVGWGQGEIDSSATIAEESEAKSALLDQAMKIFSAYLNVPESRALQERWEKLKNAP